MKPIKKKVEELKKGDVFSLKTRGEKYTYNLKCMRQNDKWEVFHFGEWSGIYMLPNTDVYFHGKCEDIGLWDEEERKPMARKIWEEIKPLFSNEDAEKIATAYSVKLFGKRGYYSEDGERKYYINDYRRMKKLADNLNGQAGFISHYRQDEDIENLDYSRQYETECYGYKQHYIRVTCGEQTFYV